MIRRLFTVLAGLVLLFSIVAVPVAAGETPHHRDCDGIAFTVALVCAGADAGGNGECVNLSQTEIACSYSYAWNLLAWSPAFLPGEGEMEWEFAVTSCISGVGCEVLESGGGSHACTFTLPSDTCGEMHHAEGAADYVLELGQCVTVTAWAFGHTKAWVPQQGLAVWEAEIAEDNAHGGAACALDDGRA